MNLHRVAPRSKLESLARTLAVVALAALVQPAAAAPGSLLEITLGPHETSWLHVKELKVTLDGAPLPVALPAEGADPAVPIYSEVVKPGSHKFEVEAGFTGDSKAFNYVEGYVFRMRGQLDIEAPPGEAVGVQVRVVSKSGLTVEWTDRFQLAVRASRYPSEKAAAAQIPDEAPPAAVAVAAAEPQKPASQPPPPPPTPREPGRAGSCSLGPLHFAFGKYALDASGRAALDRFAACLKANDESAVIEGHADPRGPADFNDWLSGARADAAAEYLARRGVDRSRIQVRSYGSTHLACSEPTQDCNARNRRAEVETSRP